MSAIRPLLPFITTSKCCGAARQSGHSLQLQNLRGANSQTAGQSVHSLQAHQWLLEVGPTTSAAPMTINLRRN
jgi:hypothetical protein